MSFLKMLFLLFWREFLKDFVCLFVFFRATSPDFFLSFFPSHLISCPLVKMKKKGSSGASKGPLADLANFKLTFADYVGE